MSPRAAALVCALPLLVGCPAEEATPGSSQASPAPRGGEADASPDASERPAAPAPTRPVLEDVALPAGRFVMGSAGASQRGRDDERPRRERPLHAFRIDLREVTNAAYAAFLASEQARTHRGCHPDEPGAKDHTPGRSSAEELEQGAVADPFGGAGRGDHPVVLVDWYDAYAFAAWVGRRLPTEEEFERAARGTDGRRFPWGPEAPKEDGAFPWANAFLADGFPMTAPVGSFPRGAAPEGALDLAGNVWEWTASRYAPYRGAPDDTPADPSQMVIRGGGWNSASTLLLRGAMRVGRDPTYRSAALGFRTAAEETQEGAR